MDLIESDLMKMSFLADHEFQAITTFKPNYLPRKNSSKEIVERSPSVVLFFS
jgi:hypothetical protein